MVNYLVECPNCRMKIYLTKDELFKEKYILCLCGLFKNENYLEK